MAALIAWMPVVRVDLLVKDGAKRRRLRRSTILDKKVNTNRVLSKRSRPLSQCLTNASRGTHRACCPAPRAIALRPRRTSMISTVIGGAMLPHAPQFFTMPDTEDKALVAKVREVAADVGKRLRALEPDLWIIFSNDHAEQFFHTAAPPFTIHVGGEATGDFAGRKFHWKVPSEIGFELVRQLYRQNFDPAFTSTAKFDYAMGIPLTHLGHTDPVLPIYVNAYLPPQPPIERCYALGQAVARAVTAMGLRTVVLASGGMSHFPGTERYGNPELAWDNQVLAK